MGAALMGHKAGDRVTVRVSEDYSYDMTVLAVEQGRDDENIEILKF